MSGAAPKYDQTTPTVQRLSKSFALPNELLDSVDERLGARVMSINDVCGEAMAMQLEKWVASAIECTNPETGEQFIKGAGDLFPTRGSQGFRKGRARGQHYPQTSRLTVRVNDELLVSWLNAVWYQQHVYTYPSDALVEALELRLRN